MVNIKRQMPDLGKTNLSPAFFYIIISIISQPISFLG